MKDIFTSTTKFTVVFFVVLFLDIFIKLYCPVFPYRFISKPLVLLLLIGFYYENRTKGNDRKDLWMFLGMGSFFIGDILIINHLSLLFLGLSLFFFSIGKVFFSLNFSHKNDFDVLRLVPFSGIMFAYAVFLIGVVLKGLKEFLVPALVSFFLSLLMFQFAFLRKGICSKKSYIYVFVGVMIFIVSESMMAIKTFKHHLPFEDFFIMAFYGISMYYIVLGVIYGQKQEISLS